MLAPKRDNTLTADRVLISIGYNKSSLSKTIFSIFNCKLMKMRGVLCLYFSKICFFCKYTLGKCVFLLSLRQKM